MNYNYDLALERSILKIKYYRLAHNFKQSELADKLNISLRNYQRMEAGEAIPSFDIQIKLAQSFGVDLPEIFSIKPPEKPSSITVLTADEFFRQFPYDQNHFRTLLNSPTLQDIDHRFNTNQMLKDEAFMEADYPLFFSCPLHSILNNKLSELTRRPSNKIMAYHGWDIKEFSKIWDYLLYNKIRFYKTIVQKQVPAGPKFFENYQYNIFTSDGKIRTLGALKMLNLGHSFQ